ncbi:major facilitator superfamily domain-containing protein [Pavlovales sp. CCMP2436]|nr:major facilitator superfamily domain-containing protein [Pavlovales sp. CCMP2436]
MLTLRRESGRAEDGSAEGGSAEGGHVPEENLTTGARPPPAIEGSRAVWLLIAICGICDATYGSLAPFFPQHALGLGLSHLATGLIFSSFMWAGVIWTPVATRISRSTSPRLLLSVCVLLQAGLTAAFAPMAAISNAPTFFVATFSVRLIQGFVTTTYEVAVSSLLIRSCAPERVGTWLGIQESARGVGLMLGPALGGVLYGFGGFGLPFLANAGVLLLLGLLVLVTLRTPEGEEGARRDKAPPVGMGELLSNPGIGVTTALFCALAATLSMLDPTLGPHEASAFHLRVEEIGLTFSATTLAYALLAPAAGWLGGRVGNFRTLVCGMGVTGISYILLGPSPWLPFFEETETLLVVALVVLGIGASTLTCSVPTMLDVARKAGYNVEDISDTVGGLMSLAWTGGALTGPLYGSAVVSSLGFETATSVTGLALFILTVAGTLLFQVAGRRAAPLPGDGAAASDDYFAVPEPPDVPGPSRAAAPSLVPAAPWPARPRAAAAPQLGEPLLDPAASRGEEGQNPN